MVKGKKPTPHVHMACVQIYTPQNILDSLNKNGPPQANVGVGVASLEEVCLSLFWLPALSDIELSAPFLPACMTMLLPTMTILNELNPETLSQLN